MTDPVTLTDQQQRDAQLVRQTAALETIANKTSSIQTYVSWGFWIAVVCGGIYVLLAAAAIGGGF